jgi:hypothetical protein
MGLGQAVAVVGPVACSDGRDPDRLSVIKRVRLDRSLL